MRNARKVAKMLITRYKLITQNEFGTSELMLQKLMYFSQRQSFALTGEPLFEDVFEGWKHGPVLRELRFFFDLSFEITGAEPTETEKYILDSVINEYGSYSPWALRDLTHDEISWKNSRMGLNDSDQGFREMKLEDIQKDAEKVKIYDPLYDVYLNEFEEFTGEVFK